MKTTIFISLFLLPCAILHAQPKIDLKKDVKIITTPKGAITDIPRPSINSEVLKMKTKPLAQTSELKVYMEEYVNGENVPDALSLIEWERGDSGDVFICELIPDLINTQHLHLFLNVPGVTDHREKKTEFPKYFEYRIYQKAKSEKLDSVIPVLLIYEDDYRTEKVKKLIDRYLVNDSLQISKNAELLPQIERYFLVYYQLSKVPND